MRKPRVFISHKETKSCIVLVRLLENFLVRNGWDVYIAIDNPESGILADKLTREIKESDFLIAIIDEKKQSISVHQEIAYAIDRTEIIIMVDKKIMYEDLGVLNKGRELELFDSDNFEYSLRRVLKSMQKKMREKPPEIVAGTRMAALEPPISQNSPSQESSFAPRNDRINGAGSRLAGGEPVARYEEPPAWYRNGSEPIKMIINDIDCTLKYGRTWEVCQASTPICGRPVWITAIVDADTGHIITHMPTMAKPTTYDMSIMFRLAQIVAGTPKTIKTDLHPICSKAIKKIFESTVSKKSKLPAQRHHNERLSVTEEYLESILKRASKNLTEDDLEGIGIMVQYEIITHNYILPFDTTGRIPAAAAGFGLRFTCFDDIKQHASSYEKAFIDKLGPSIRLVRIQVNPKNKKIRMELKPHVKESDAEKIDSVLQECGFQYIGKKWTRKSSFLDTYAINFKDRELPARTFEICDCGNLARTLQEVFLMNGFRNGSVVKTQPSCRECRYGSDSSGVRFRLRQNHARKLNASMYDFAKDTPAKASEYAVMEPCKDYSWILERGRQTSLARYQACC